MFVHSWEHFPFQLNPWFLFSDLHFFLIFCQDDTHYQQKNSAVFLVQT